MRMCVCIGVYTSPILTHARKDTHTDTHRAAYANIVKCGCFVAKLNLYEVISEFENFKTFDKSVESFVILLNNRKFNDKNFSILII